MQDYFNYSSIFLLNIRYNLFFFHTATAKILDHRALRLCEFYGAYQLRQQPAAVLYRFIHYIFAIHATTNSREMLHLAKENDLVLVYANSCSEENDRMFSV